MRIVYHILNTWYSGGLTRVLANKANYLAEHGHEVFVITTDQEGENHFYEMSPKIQFIDLGINYYLHDQENIIGKLQHLPIKLLHHRSKLSKTLKELKADIVISLFGKEVFFLPFIKDGSKKILETHTSKYAWVHSRPGVLGKLMCWVDTQVIKRFDKFIVLTHLDKADWGKLSNVAVIPNANTFETDQVSNLDSKVVLAAGRYSYEKNFESLLRAWQIVSPAFPDWELRLRGMGLEQLDAMIQELGLEGTVTRKNATNIMSEYLDSSIYVLSSRYEGLGLVLLEAQVCGLPLVSYACKCGPLEIVTDGDNGYLVEEGNHNLLAKRLMELMASPELRKEMGKRSKIHSQKFSEESIMGQWENLFLELTKQ